MDISVRSYLAVGFLLLLSQNSNSTPQELAAGTTWAPATAAESASLVLVQCGPDKTSANWSSGSIISDSKVLTYSTCDEDEIVVYAGSNSYSVTKDLPKGVQVRKVTEVDQANTFLWQLRILTVNESWILTANVASVGLPLGNESLNPAKSCQVLGFKQADENSRFVANKLNQTIGDGRQCSLWVIWIKRLYSLAPSKTELLTALDQGGPALCDNKQWGVSVEGKEEGSVNCNEYINISSYREFIVAARGHSLHHSKYEVLGFLASTIVIFLQY